MITVSGSGHWISVTGDITAEVSYHDAPCFLAFSDGTVLAVRRDAEGVWRVEPREASPDPLSRSKLTMAKDGGKTDVYLFDSNRPVRWMVHGPTMVRRG